MKKCRADERLVHQLNLPSLALAQALIMEGRVMSGDRKILRASEPVRMDEILRVRGEIDAYVSRGAHKLKRALDAFGISLGGAVCVDVGCSTGGFTDVMLRAGAARVYAVDVGYNVLDYRLRSDARVVCMERTNARFLKPEDFDPRPSFGATDVSFISLKPFCPRRWARSRRADGLSRWSSRSLRRRRRRSGRRASSAIPPSMRACWRKCLRLSRRSAGGFPDWTSRRSAARRETSNS